MGAPASPVTGIPRALTIAGSDSGGGAGIQADLKVFFALGCHGMSALTALTAQNTVGVSGIADVEPDFVRAQIDAVVDDIGVDAAKTGMLARAPVVRAVAEAVTRHRIQRLVVDPVSVSKHGARLLAGDAIEALRSELLPLALVVTPNTQEAEALTGIPVTDRSSMEAAADRLLETGCGFVLVKGGHLAGERAVDLLVGEGVREEVSGPRYDTKDTHGTGCTLSAAIAARLAHGDDVPTAVATAKDYISGAIAHGLRIGKGVGPVDPGWRMRR